MDGFLLIDKPAGMTSHDVVDALRRITGIRKIGHAGTLDPFATGLLILGVGKATKQLGDLLGLDKEYLVTAELGATSDTYDVEGKITPTIGVIHESPLRDIESMLDRFRGGYRQKAPAFSAKKVKGKKLYELARKGYADVESLRPEKDIRIDELRVMRYEYPLLELFVHCSSGTYIRSLVHDIGQALGTGAYAKALRRTAIGNIRVEQAISLEGLDRTGAEAALLPELDRAHNS